MSVTIYHNPRCSKSRQTLEILESRSIEPAIVEYLKTPPSPDELKRILSLLGIGARDLLRTKEPEYKELGLDDLSLSEDVIIKAMVETPRLIERPIVVKDGKAAIGRPPEQVIDIL
jgi:arsenate reductase (glutaredoxin)